MTVCHLFGAGTTTVLATLLPPFLCIFFVVSLFVCRCVCAIRSLAVCRRSWQQARRVVLRCSGNVTKEQLISAVLGRSVHALSLLSGNLCNDAVFRQLGQFEFACGNSRRTWSLGFAIWSGIDPRFSLRGAGNGQKCGREMFKWEGILCLWLRCCKWVVLGQARGDAGWWFRERGTSTRKLFARWTWQWWQFWASNLHIRLGHCHPSPFTWWVVCLHTLLCFLKPRSIV